MKSTKDLYEEQLQKDDDEYNELARQDDMSWWGQQDADEQRMAERLHTTTGEENERNS